MHEIGVECVTDVDFAIDVDHVPSHLELTNVIVTQQSVFFVRIEQRKVLHDDGCVHSNNTFIPTAIK